MEDEKTFELVKKEIRQVVKEGKKDAHIRIHQRLVVGVQAWLETYEYIINAVPLAGETVRLDVNWLDGHEKHV